MSAEVLVVCIIVFVAYNISKTAEQIRIAHEFTVRLV